MAENSESKPSALRGDSLAWVKRGGARNGGDTRGGEKMTIRQEDPLACRKVEKRPPSGNSALADTEGVESRGEKPAKAAIGQGRGQGGGARGREKPARESG